jgi:hypothetical protein
LAENAGPVLGRVQQRFRTGRDHGLYCTVVEEVLRAFFLANLGMALWKLIKEDTAEAFGPDPSTYGGTAFLEELRRLCEQRKAPRITLIGHSAGAVYVANLLDHAKRRIPRVRFNLLLLAPASTFAAFARTCDRHKDRIENIRLFGMQDQVECRDAIPLYPRSLLYLVSGILEAHSDEPLLGMQRYFVGEQYRGMDTVKRVRRYLDRSGERLVWSVVDGGPGLSSQCRKHQDFDQEEVTVRSMQHVISSGY